MPRPRKSLVSLDATPYYHCVSRCVRRAFLCGEDVVSGTSYEHRRGWIEQRLLELADIFAIDIAAYAVMSNHYHVVLHIDKDKALDWSEIEVIERWHRLFNGSMLSQRYYQGESMSKAELNALSDQVEEWRERLTSISWFMRCTNEAVAREANKEDDVTGRFWEGRFKSQALLDEKALAACMVYVDLNPIRAKMAETPEESDYTSVKQRIHTVLKARQSKKAINQTGLLNFVGYPRKDMPEGLPFSLADYLELVDWTGRVIREDKRGAVPANMPPLLERLAIDAQHWMYLSKHFESPFKHLVGTARTVRNACEELGKQWSHGIKQCEVLFSSR
jgi:REP element-mobilizing transposase RayT